MQEKVDKILEKELLKTVEIPQLSLYMDQIITLMNSRENGEEKPLTKTMINNYSKMKILEPIKGKTYPRQQVLQLLMISILKSTLSMEELKEVMIKLYGTDDLGEEGFEDCYKRFNTYYDSLKDDIKNLAYKLIPESDDKDAVVSLLCISLLRSRLEEISNLIIEEYFKEKKDEQ